MSIGLMIESVNGDRIEEYLPVSGEAFFEQFWLPICRDWDLKLVPQFQTGRSFDHTDLPLLLAELQKVKNAVNSSQDESAHLLRRVNLLIERLSALEGKEARFFIG